MIRDRHAEMSAGGDRPLLRRLMAAEQSWYGSLLLRLALVVAVLQPWSWELQRVAFGAETLHPDLLAVARSLGIDPLDPALWPSVNAVVGGVIWPGLVFGVVWWAVSRLRRVLQRRTFGMLAAVVPVLAYGALQFAVEWVQVRLQTRFGLDPFSDAVPVWQGWLAHPLLLPGALGAALGILNLLGVLVGELVLQAVEGRYLLLQAREGALRARLVPHFLYNALNTLSAQIAKDPEGAQETTQRLSGLFEQVSRATQTPHVPLGEELAFVEDQLALERRRLGERLSVRVEIPEEFLDMQVPVLSLQVLVENALKHAIAPRVEGGTLHLMAKAEGAQLWVEVTDSGDGVGLAGGPAGMALANLRARLRRPSDLESAQTPEGFRVRFRVPLREK